MATVASKRLGSVNHAPVNHANTASHIEGCWPASQWMKSTAWPLNRGVPVSVRHSPLSPLFSPIIILDVDPGSSNKTGFLFFVTALFCCCRLPLCCCVLSRPRRAATVVQKWACQQPTGGVKWKDENNSLKNNQTTVRVYSEEWAPR